ncbi:hypothetical protein HMPREF3191_01276 [Veillonellaceae bacterium DNF00626]|nr:hypothetical protein HMPREF3191_01276 [Veillonellaceae bacterium DNF00626]
MFCGKMEYVNVGDIFRKLHQLSVINLIKTTSFYSQLIFRMIQ